MTVKFPDQKQIKIGNIWHTPQIDTNTQTGETDIMYFKGIQVFGSKNDDKVYARGNLEATYRFENGGSDDIRVIRFNDGNYTNEELNMKGTRLDSTDRLILENRFYDENNHWYMTKTLTETGNDYNDYKIKLLDGKIEYEDIPTEESNDNEEE